MFRRVLGIVLGCCLLGQGCASAPSTTSTHLLTPTGEPSPEGFVEFREGFGKLPGSSPLPTGNEPRVTLTLATELPSIPTDATVLREWNGAPNETLLRNIASAEQIPSGVLGRAPSGDALGLRWRNGDGYLWSFSAENQTIAFNREQPLPVRAPSTEEAFPSALQQQAQTFLTDHGIDSSRWGQTPEFRSSASSAFTVAYYADSRDGQVIVDRMGHNVSGAALQMDRVTGQISDGWFTLSQGTDRSNYYALSPEEVLARVTRGGTNPMTGTEGTIVIDRFTRVLYRHVGIMNGQSRTFYIPALLAQGTFTRGDRIAQYTTVVPLIRDDAFEK